MAILRSFERFADEAALIGKMLAGYADLEIDLLHCVNAVRQDMDATLRAMFEDRGEKRRIDTAEGLGIDLYARLGLVEEFVDVIAAMHRCRGIRNQYAHCIWWDDNTQRLAFAAIEDVATQDACIPARLSDLEPNHVTVALLEEQLGYFNYTDNLMIWLIHAGLRAQGLPFYPGIARPAVRAQPPLRIPE